MSESNENKAGMFAIICSFLFPIVGIILYFIKKGEVENRGAYIKAAGLGILLGFILRLAAGAY
jgi:hypothetical protein